MLRKLDGLTGFLDLHIRDAAIESKERRALLHTITLHGARFCHQAGHWHPNPRIRRWLTACRRLWFDGTKSIHICMEGRTYHLAEHHGDFGRLRLFGRSAVTDRRLKITAPTATTKIPIAA